MSKPPDNDKTNLEPTKSWPLWEVFNDFAVALISYSDEVNLAWYVAREVVGKMGFVDCVVYYHIPEKNVLRQIAAIGEKNPYGDDISNLLEIPVGSGITGEVAKTLTPIIINDLKDDKRYIPDLVAARSEICVPLIDDGKLVGVIDCEHPDPGFFKDSHLEVLNCVAALMTAKLEFIRNNKALSESERRHSVIFNKSMDGIVSIDLEGKFVEVNPAAAEMFGVLSEQLIGKLLVETIIPPELRTRHSNGFNQFIQTGKRKSNEQRVETIGLRSSGERFPLELTVTPYDIDGQEYLTGFLRDITVVKKAKLAEEAGQLIQRQFSAFLEFLPSAFLIKDVEGRCLNANSQWHEWFNPENVDIRGKTIFDFFPEEFAHLVMQQDLMTATEKKIYSAEVETPLPNGTTRTSLLQKFPVTDFDGNVIAIGGVNTDISERKKMEEELRDALLKANESSQSKSVFLATMSHELRTPLNAIIGFSDMLVGQYFGDLGDKRYLDYAKNIQMSGRHLSSLIGEVLDISSIELGIKDVTNNPVSLDTILEECVNSQKLNALKAGITLALEVEADLPKIWGDERALKQIFFNLLTNSLKYSDSGDHVTAQAISSANEVIVKIVDTGIGIDESYLPTLTEPFVRGHDDSLTSHEGVGLGLSIVKSLVEAHNAQLHIESKKGEGTTVTVAFPRTPTV